MNQIKWLAWAAVMLGLLFPGVASAHFSGITTPANVVGERRTWALVELRGLAPSNVKPYVRYGASSTDATSSSGSYAEARCVRHDADHLRCYVVFPHRSRTSGWNPVDQNPRRFDAGQRVHFRWYKETHTSLGEVHLHDVAPVRSFIMPRRLAVGVMGDSYAAGEGAPHTFDLDHTRRWIGPSGELNCHRSRNSGHWKGVQNFVTANPGMDVHWYFRPCSGARIYDGVLVRQSSEFPLPPGYMTSYSQMDWLRRWLDAHGYPRLDALVINIGGNDIGFVDVIKGCMGSINCANNATLNARVSQGLSGLFRVRNGVNEGWYKELNDRLRAELNVRHVFITEYPDPTRDTRTNFCNMPVQLDWCVGDAERLLSQAEISWVYSSVLVALNRKIKEAASALGWVVAGDSQVTANGNLGNDSGNMARTRARGLCDCSTGYFNNVRQALLQNDYRHAVHPNARGYQNSYAPTLTATLNQRLRPTAARSESPLLTTNFTISRGVGADAEDLSWQGADLVDEVQAEEAFVDDYPIAVETRSARPGHAAQAEEFDQREDRTGAARVRHDVREYAQEEALYGAPVLDADRQPPARPRPEDIRRAEQQEARQMREPQQFRGRPTFDDVPPEHRQQAMQQQAHLAALFEELNRLRNESNQSGPPRPQQ